MRSVEQIEYAEGVADAKAGRPASQANRNYQRGWKAEMRRADQRRLVAEAAARGDHCPLSVEPTRAMCGLMAGHEGKCRFGTRVVS